MQLKRGIAIVTMGAALACGGTAFAAAGTESGQVQVPAFSKWADDYSARHDGRISREAYMNEMSRRWDMYDRERRGLTPNEVNSMYIGSGQVAVGGPAPGYQPASK